MDFVRQKRSTVSLEMTPLVDVVFQLLIFFMLSSSFSHPAIRLNLPKAVTTDVMENDRVVISIEKTGQYYVNSEPVEADHLLTRLKDRLMSAKDKSVDLRGDSQAAYSFFLAAMDAARQAGAATVNIVHGGKG